ncbi:MAG: hypothetical protein AAF585_22490 [Verrucomicrobiota bacterium]
MNSEDQSNPAPAESNPAAAQPDPDVAKLDARLIALEQTLLGSQVDQDPLTRRFEELDAANGERKPSEKMHEVAEVAKVCANALDQIEIGVINLEDTHSPEDQQLLAQRVDGLREQVYQALRTILESRQHEAQQELVATLASLLDNGRSPLPGPSVN